MTEGRVLTVPVSLASSSDSYCRLGKEVAEPLRKDKRMPAACRSCAWISEHLWKRSLGLQQALQGSTARIPRPQLGLGFQVTPPPQEKPPLFISHGVHWSLS